MPEVSKPANVDWVTIVTLRISFKASTFTDSLRRERINSLRSKPQCSCSNLRQLHPYAGVKVVAQGLIPPKTVTARFVMTDPEKIEQAGKLCAPDPDRQFEHPQLFRFWILSLATLLSALCDGDHSSNTSEAPQSMRLRPFKEGEVTKRGVCEDLRRLLNAPLNPSEKEQHGMGYVYILRSQLGASTTGELKIGFSKYHPEHRAHEIAQCYAMPEVVGHTPLLPHAKRLESIIHMELQGIRKVHSCSRCNGNHREWFTIPHAESREIVMRWSKWLLQRPYVNGKLTDGWKEYLATKDFGSMDDNVYLADYWQTVIDDFPKDDFPGTESERIGQYLNQCHWDVTCARLGIDKFETDVCDKCERRASILSDLGTNFSYDKEGVLDAVVESFRKIKLLDEERDSQESTDSGCAGCADFNFLKPLPTRRSRGKKINRDKPFGDWVDKNTRFGRMFHPAMPSGYLLMPDLSPGRLSLLLQTQCEDERLARAQFWELINSLKDIKTGARSVSDPVLGITESPLGDATLLPVLALKDLTYFDPPVPGWVGITPTHSGFQYLQEGYKEGKWFGRTPKFQLPKAYRKAGIKRVPMPDPRNKASRSENGKGASNEGKKYSTGYEDIDHIMQNREGSGSSFELSRGPDLGSETFTWAQPLNDEFKKALEQKLEECRRPGGREKLERDFAKFLRHYGVDACFDIPDYGDTTDSEGEEASPGLVHSPAFPSTVPTKRREAPSSAEPEFSAKKAKQWLESL